MADGGVPEQFDHLIEVSRLISLQDMSAIPQSREASLTAMYRDIALIRPPYWGTPTLLVRASRSVVDD